MTLQFVSNPYGLTEMRKEKEKENGKQQTYFGRGGLSWHIFESLD